MTPLMEFSLLLLRRSSLGASTPANVQWNPCTAKRASVQLPMDVGVAKCALDNRETGAAREKYATKRRDFTVTSNWTAAPEEYAEVPICYLIMKQRTLK